MTLPVLSRLLLEVGFALTAAAFQPDWRKRPSVGGNPFVKLVCYPLARLPWPLNLPFEMVILAEARGNEEVPYL